MEMNHVLIVEDDKEIREGVEIYLKSQGYVVFQAADGVEGLKKDYTIVMVTHNMQQAVRVSDNTAFFLLGEVIEYNDTEKLFSIPSDKRTEDYITGRFG